MENSKAKLSAWLSPLVHLSSNWISRVGVVLVSTATIFWLFLLPSFITGEVNHPYLGIVIFMLLPAAFFGGLILIPVGIALRKRHERKTGAYPDQFLPLDFNNVEFRRLVIFVVLISAVNVVIGAQLTYSGVNYMDTVSFCGTTCHTVMQPEYTAYQDSPHSRVACVQCHIGPGASWFVRSKLSGTKQVFAVILNDYPRPIPVPVQNLRPARQTCEACHWPQRFEGNRLVIIPKYAEDEKNAVTKTVLLLHIGGGGVPGIHSAHVGPGITIRYGSDESRQNMKWVQYEDAVTHRTSLYVASGTKPSAVDTSGGRVMDCIDCHNRPTHTFQLPDRALDHALAAGEISPSLPYVKKEGLELLKRTYSSRREADEKMPEAFAQYYQQNYPTVYSQQQALVAQAAEELVAIYNRNVFPAMKVTWGTYPNNIGHMDFPGCFRCHGTLQSATDPSATIPQDCSTCHNLLAMDDPNPKILEDLGLAQATAGNRPTK
jgi:NapC/NirT cytochrome c family, N-terminal region